MKENSIGRVCELLMMAAGKSDKELEIGQSFTIRIAVPDSQYFMVTFNRSVKTRTDEIIYEEIKNGGIAKFEKYEPKPAAGTKPSAADILAKLKEKLAEKEKEG